METIGITSFEVAQTEIKRLALLFDQISIFNLQEKINENSETILDMRWLQEKGIISDVRELNTRTIDTSPDGNMEQAKKYALIAQKVSAKANKEIRESKKMLRNGKRELDQLGKEMAKIKAGKRSTISPEEINKRLAELTASFKTITADKFDKNFNLGLDLISRGWSSYFRLGSGLNTYPVIRQLGIFPDDILTEKGNVLHVVMKRIPVPNQNVSLEAILDYKSDPDSKTKFIRLQNWINEITKSQLTHVEIEEKLDWLISEYEQHMQLHKLKTHTGTFETVIVSTAEIIEDLTRFRWGKLATSLFSLTHRKVDLLGAEMAAPGREIAYIVRAKELFEP